MAILAIPRPPKAIITMHMMQQNAETSYTVIYFVNQDREMCSKYGSKKL